MLWSRNSATMVTWQHTSPLYWERVCFGTRFHEPLLPVHINGKVYHAQILLLKQKKIRLIMGLKKYRNQYRNLPYSLVLITPLEAKSAGSHPSVSIRQCCQLKVKEELWSYVIYIAKWPHYLYPGFNCTVKCEMCITRKLPCRAIIKAHLLTDFFGTTLPLKLLHSLT